MWRSLGVILVVIANYREPGNPEVAIIFLQTVLVYDVHVCRRVDFLLKEPFNMVDGKFPREWPS